MRNVIKDRSITLVRIFPSYLTQIETNCQKQYKESLTSNPTNTFYYTLLNEPASRNLHNLNRVDLIGVQN